MDSLGTIGSTDLLAELANFDDASGSLIDLANIFGDSNMTKEQVKTILDGFDDISDATKEAVLSSNLFTTSQIASATGTNIFTVALAKAKEGVIAFGKSLWAFAGAHPIIAGLTVAVIALGAAFGIYKKFGPTHENYIKKLNEETENLKSVQSELQSVNKELETTKARMEELQAKDKLSFVEEEELARLKEQTAELERQEAILLAQEKRARQKQIDAALKAAGNDPNSVDNVTQYYTSARQGNTYAPVMPYGANNDAVIANNWETNLKNLTEAKDDLEAAKQELSDTNIRDYESKEYKALEKQVENAQARVDKYNDVIHSMNDTWKTEYGEIGYIENATTEAEKQWNDFYRQHADYVDQWMLLNDGYKDGKATVLDRVFGVTGTDVAQKFKEEFESAVKRGKDPSDVIEELLSNKDYSSAFSGLEEQFGITLDHIKGYFTQTGEFAINPEFDITKYTKTISNHSAVISEYQEAIQKLGKGSFTMDDFMALIEKSPELAKGVDISSNAFYGLSKNLNKAIKSHTKDFIDDLERLKDSLEAAGKETDSVDQLIAAIEKMPGDSLDDSIQKYQTLADAMDEARVAQNQLLASMEENPNEGYETRGEAMSYMKTALESGEIGSESNVWNVASRYGFTYDSAASINENADALAQFIAVREKWYKQDDDGNYTYKGTESFIEAVETAVNNNAELQKYLQWNYDETTGSLSFDFENKNLPKIIDLLGQTEGLIGLTKNEWMDLLVQVGQFFDIKWGN